MLFQIGGDWFSIVIWMVFLVFMMFFYPRFMVSQIMWKLEKSAKELEDMSKKAKKIVVSEISSSPDKRLKESVDRFFEFFVVSPVSLDPFGIVKKFDHILENQRDRFRYFVSQVAPKQDAEKQACIEMGLAGGIAVHEIAKVVRHYVEMVRKTKSIQIAMVLQMQLPLIERIAKAMFRGTKALSKGNPIGDALGPMVAAELIGEKKVVEIDDDIVMARTELDGREALVLKATGPGGRIGRPGRAVEKLVKTNKISRIITIDAAAKLEGEKTGSIAEGVGVAMGGPGVERSYIEDSIVKKGIPIDSIVVKMSQEEAIAPMRKDIKDAIPEVRESIKRSLERTKKGDKVIIVGVGNTSGVGNSKKDADKAAKWIDSYEKKLKRVMKERGKRDMDPDV
jgi:hypothetical protein